MTKELILKHYLEDNPRARERRNKVRCISNIMRKYHPSLKDFPNELMEEIVDEIIAYERYWRKILVDNPELQGTDYNTKKIMVQKKQIELGYESGYNQLTDDFVKNL